MSILYLFITSFVVSFAVAIIVGRCIDYCGGEDDER